MGFNIYLTLKLNVYIQEYFLPHIYGDDVDDTIVWAHLTQLSDASLS